MPLHQSPPPKTHTQKRLLKAASGSICPFPSKWLKNGQTGTEQPSRQITETSSPPKWSPLKFLGCWQSEASVLEVTFKSPPPPVSSPDCVCVCARVCVSYSFQALLGFTGVWTAGRGALIGQNDAEMDRKPPLEFLKLIFSHPHFSALPPFQSLTHPPTPSPIFRLFFFLTLSSSSASLCFCSLGCQTVQVLLH